MTIREREKLLTQMVKDHNISEKDIPLYRFLLGLFAKGAYYRKVIKWTQTPSRHAYKWWDNLKRGGYFSGNKICVESDWPKNAALECHLMACVAMGYLERRCTTPAP